MGNEKVVAGGHRNDPASHRHVRREQRGVPEKGQRAGGQIGDGLQPDLDQGDDSRESRGDHTEPLVAAGPSAKPLCQGQRAVALGDVPGFGGVRFGESGAGHVEMGREIQIGRCRVVSCSVVRCSRV